MKKHIAIIGAGYTGLVAALRLSGAGHDVTILEKGNTVGGLASDFSVEGASLEKAYHHLFKTDTDIIDLASELGVSNRLLWHPSSISIYYDGRVYPFKGALDLIRFKPLRFHNRIRAGLVVLYLQKKNDWKAFEKISAYDWMRKYAGKQVTDVIWEPLLKGKFDTYYDKVSMAWLWARIHIRAQSRESGGEKLGYFDGGFQIFTDALVSALRDNGVQIKLKQDIGKISNEKSGKVRVGYQDGSKEIFDICIATVPSGVFARLVQGNKLIKESYINKLNSIKYLGARLLIFSSSQKLSDYYWHNINDLELPFLVFINHTKFIPKRQYNGRYVYYIATYVPHDHDLFTIDDKSVERIWFDGVKKIFPSFDKTKITEKHHFRFANAQHIVQGNYRKLIPSYKSPLPNVFLSNFSQIYPEDRGTNFAVREGNKIAMQILGDIKK